MTRVKICGVRDVDTAVEAVKGGADMIGLMFAESRRKVTPQECYDIVTALHELRGHAGAVEIRGPDRGEVTAKSWFGVWNDAIDDVFFRVRPLLVGVFAGMSAEEVNNVADAAHLDLVQLSGGENEAFIDAVERPVIKAIHVDETTTAFDVFDRAVAGHARGIMLDTASAHAQGGTGQTFDWEVAADVSERLPIMLAGGLSPENVAAAVTQVRPWAVDVSSGVETDGTKDTAKVRAFIAAAKEAGRDH